MRWRDVLPVLVLIALILLVLGLALAVLFGQVHPAGAQVTCPMTDLVVRCYIDQDGDGQQDPGEMPVQCTVLLRYEGEGLSPLVIANKDGLGVTTVTPGVYQVILQAWSTDDVMPVIIYPVWALASAGRPVVVQLPFWQAIPPTPVVTGTPSATATATANTMPIPTATRTPTPQATPTMHACYDYYTNCKPSCPVGTVQDVYGRCGLGLVCCLPATPTVRVVQAIPSFAATPFLTPTARPSAPTATRTRTATPTMKPVRLPKTGG